MMTVGVTSLALFLAILPDARPGDSRPGAEITAQDAPKEAAGPFFRIRVVDDVTLRAVPLVELRMVDGTSFVTDSAGAVAFYEPGLMGKELFFHVSSHGYEYPADYFGYRGVRLTPVPGGSATIPIRRINLAERLYRITGIGIYRDSRLLGDPLPLAEPLINGLVAGQDSALAVPHNGRLYWFWGDTGRPAYPLGNFKTSGATSQLPGSGGLDPGVGIDLAYYVDASGFSRQMAPIGDSGVVWLSGLQTAPDRSGIERMFAHFTRLQGLGSPIEHGLALWNESTEVFDKVSNIPLDNPLHPEGSAPFKHVDGGIEYIYFGNPYPNLRVRAELELIGRPDQYQGYTPLLAGTRFAGAGTQLERDTQGELVWAWKSDTPPLNPAQQRELVTADLMERSESPYRLADADTGKQISEHNGTVAWNAYRQRWIMILGQSFGSTSFLGEIYYAESKNIEGPWIQARKIVTHDDYSFYNVAQRPFFDQDGGRLIHFEGTYTMSFSGTETATPRYDYNQIMYRLDLSDPRLFAP
ncbi:MAG: hypothetical protein EYC70_08155 [Planctomycetota bacterium]|nr:MAG: hypothetical protein EYC70_08155 [Planctomycetota bacterium]